MKAMSYSLLDDLQAIANHETFAVTTSLLWDPACSLNDNAPRALPLRFHQARLLASANAFNWEEPQGILAGKTGIGYLSKQISDHTAKLPSKPHKLTLMVNQRGAVNISSAPALPPLYPFHLPSGPPPAFDQVKSVIYIAPHATYASVFTSYKTTHRPMYTAIRLASHLQAEAPTSAEILLYNGQDEVTEASLSTVYFWRHEGWVTPSARCGGNVGSSRALALENGWCTESVLQRDDVCVGEVIGLSNGVRGFWHAIVQELPDL